MTYQPKGNQFVYAWPAALGWKQGEPDGSLLRRLVAADTWARFLRHRGQLTLFATGIDAFSEAVLREAVREGHLPEDGNARGAESLTRIRDSLDVLADLSPVDTSDPCYYRITQWIFLELLARRLVRPVTRTLNVCTRCHSTFPLSRAAKCVTGSGEFTEREVTRWYLNTESYGERLFNDIDKSVWSPSARALQSELLGRRRGVEVTFSVSRPFEPEYDEITVFTTQIEAIYGATCLALDPFHPVLEQLIDPAYADEVDRYRERLRQGLEPRMSAARTGGFALNPASLQHIPVIITPLANTPYSDGAVMAVPGHDPNFFVLAQRFRLRIREVIHNDKAKFDSASRLVEPWLGDGVLTNSGQFTSLHRKVGRDRIISFLNRRGICRRATRYRFRRLAISGSYPWGAPVPVVHCPRCGPVGIPESELPLEPPAIPRDRLSADSRGLDYPQSDLVTTCPGCGGRAERDRQTIQPWLGRAWSFLRPLFPHLGGELPGFRTLRVETGALEETGPDASSEVAEPGESCEPAETAERSEFDEGAGSSSSSEPTRPSSGPEGPELSAGVPDSSSAPTGSSELSAVASDFSSQPGHAAETDAESARAAESVEQPAPSDDAERVAGACEPAADAAARAPSEESPLGEPAPEGGVPHEARSGDPQSVDAPPAVEGGSEPIESTGLPVERTSESGEAPAAGQDASAPAATAGQGAVATEVAAAEPSPRSRRRRQKGNEVVKADAPGDEARLQPFHVPDQAPPLATGCAFASGPGIKELLGARFITKFLYDLGECPVFEPFRRFASIGPVAVSGPSAPAAAAEPAICVAPSVRVESSALWRQWIDRYGPDAVRLHLLFLGALDQSVTADEKGLRQMARLLERIRHQVTVRRERGKFVSQRMLTEKHLLIHTLTDRLERWSFHTAVAAIMRFVRFLGNPETSLEEMDASALQTFIILLSPFAPRLASELWAAVGQSDAVEEQPWPIASEELVHPPEKEFLVIVNGKIMDRMQQPVNTKAEKLESAALQREAIREIVGHRKISKVIVVPQRLVSIVLEDAVEDGAAQDDAPSQAQGSP